MMGKLKGGILIEVVKFLRSRKEEARRLLRPELHSYLEDRVLASSWYDEQDYFELLEAVAKLYDAPDGVDPWVLMGRTGARSSLGSAYRSMVRVGDPETTLKQFPLLWEVRHDTGRARVAIDGPGEGRVWLRDYALVSHQICKAIQGTITELVHQSGARDIEVEKLQCRAAYAEACCWKLSWRFGNGP
ncbi:MAG: DUF2378 family protein [Myxococcales bacterium]|nr:DUF2378 family protein [Myxococcales bacterium]